MPWYIKTNLNFNVTCSVIFTSLTPPGVFTFLSYFYFLLSNLFCMSAVIKLPGYNGKPNNIFLIYDFNQIKDLILIVMYVDKLNTWKKIFINYKDGEWKTR